MIIYLKSGGILRERLKPDVDYYTRRVEVEGSKSLREILNNLSIPTEYIAFAYVKDKVERLDYIPSEGDVIILQPPVAGG